MQNDANIIFVRSCPHPVGHDTPAEAIADVLSQRQARESVGATQKLSGTIIEDVEWTDCSAVFHLSDQNSITILNTFGTLVWSVEKRSRRSPKDTIEFRELRLQFSSEDESSLWNRADLLEECKGSAFFRVLLTDFGLFFYTETRLLLFSVIEKVEDSSPLLFWDEP